MVPDKVDAWPPRRTSHRLLIKSLKKKKKYTATLSGNLGVIEDFDSI
jgi:hypothetical protein